MNIELMLMLNIATQSGCTMAKKFMSSFSVPYIVSNCSTNTDVGTAGNDAGIAGNVHTARLLFVIISFHAYTLLAGYRNLQM